MTHDELVKILKPTNTNFPIKSPLQVLEALRAVVELHKPKPSYLFDDEVCYHCSSIDAHTEIIYPCLTIQAIEKELK